MVKSMPKALRHFKVDPVLKINEQAKSMWHAEPRSNITNTI